MVIKKIVQNLLYKELSYQVHGAAIEVRKDFGPGHKEKLYQEALAKELKRRSIVFEKEKAIKIYSPKDGQYIGLYRPDFIIDNKIIVEIKAEKFVSRDEFKRVYDYLRNSEYELAYFINFASPKLFVKRIIFTNNRKFIKNVLVSISLILVFISGLSAEAAVLSFDSPALLTIGKSVTVSVVLDTEGQTINAVEGSISYPVHFLRFTDVSDSGSLIALWTVRPSRVDDKIHFSGIIPGGFTGKGKIMALYFETMGVGNGRVLFNTPIIALLNDGQGTAARLALKPFSFTIQQRDADNPLTVQSSPADFSAPESFSLTLTRDPLIFENKYFLVFATQDKGSGMDRYELSEIQKSGILNLELGSKKWKIVESPYVLKDQTLRSYVYVRAIDRAGNERVVSLAPQQPLSWYARWSVWSIIIGGIVLAFFLWKIIRK